VVVEHEEMVCYVQVYSVQYAGIYRLQPTGNGISMTWCLPILYPADRSV